MSYFGKEYIKKIENLLASGVDKGKKKGHNPGLGIRSFALVAFFKWVTGANRSFHSLPKEQLKQNERITKFNFFNTRAIRSLQKSYWLFLRANHSFVVLNNINSSLFSLFEKRAKEQFTLFSKNQQFTPQTKEQIPNPDTISWVVLFII